jgi:hypothetical protein
MDRWLLFTTKGVLSVFAGAICDAARAIGTDRPEVFADFATYFLEHHQLPSVADKPLNLPAPAEAAGH